MSLPTVLDAFLRTPVARDLQERMPSRGSVLRLSGLAGSSDSVMVAALVREHRQRLIAVVTPTPADAEHCARAHPH